MVEVEGGGLEGRSARDESGRVSVLVSVRLAVGSVQYVLGDTR